MSENSLELEQLDQYESEKQKIIIRTDLEKGNNISTFSGEWFNHVARMQQEFGSESLPEIVQMINKREIDPYYGISIVKGANCSNEEIYFAAKEIANSEATLENKDGSALGESLEVMIALKNERTPGDFALILNNASKINDKELKGRYLSKIINYSKILPNQVEVLRMKHILEDARKEWREIHIYGYKKIAEEGQNFYREDHRNRSEKSEPTALDSYKLLLNDSESKNPDKGKTVKLRMKRRGLEEKELGGLKYLPSIGIEIEVPPEGKMSRIYELTQLKYRIPTDHDTYYSYEFSLKPSLNYEVQSRQVYELYRLGYLKPDHYKHALHINIGGFNYKYRDAHFLMWGLLATGWSTTEKRMEMKGPYSKGDAGLIIHDGWYEDRSRIRMEMRPFSLRGINNLSRTLRTCQFIGAALKAASKPLDNRDAVEVKLANIWQGYKTKLESLLMSHNIDYHDVYEAKKDLAREIGFSERGDLGSSGDIRKQSIRLMIQTRKKVLEALQEK